METETEATGKYDVGSLRGWIYATVHDNSLKEMSDRGIYLGSIFRHVLFVAERWVSGFYLVYCTSNKTK